MLDTFALTPSVDRFAAALEACRRYLLSAANAEMPGQLTPKGGASDLVQNTLTRAYVARDQFRGATLSDLRAWLRGILVNELAMFRRHYRAACRNAARERPVEAGGRLTGGGPEPVDQLIRAEQAEALKVAVARLPADARTVLVMRLDRRLGFREIGLELGRTEEAVRKTFTRAVERLRQSPSAPAA